MRVFSGRAGSCDSVMGFASREVLNGEIIDNFVVVPALTHA
jgi:hypothetical protein